MAKKTLVGIDAGSEQSGIVIISDGVIQVGDTIGNSHIFDFIVNARNGCKDFVVAVEDMRPYNMRITDGVIQTIKFIGQLEWRLRDVGIAYDLIPRWQVKQWVFLQYKPIVEPLIERKIELAAKRKIKEGKKPRNASPSFVYVDDRMVSAAMREFWKIEKVKKVGQEAFIKDHAWSALAVASLHIVSNKPLSL
jgi:hypothetical protein